VGAAAAPGALGETAEVRAQTRPLGAGELAWLAVLPCAAVLVLAIALLGPPLGHALFEAGSDRFWPEALVAPEPVEHARYIVSLLGGPLVAAVVVAGVHRGVRLPARLTRIAIGVTGACTLAFLALTLLAQHEVLFRSVLPPNVPQRIFTLPTLVAAAAFALLLAWCPRRPALMARLASLARETRARRVACALGAALLTVVWLSAAFNTEHSIGRAEANHLIPWDMSETFAVLNGRTPLVDFHSQYAQLVPYLGAWALRVIGTTVGAWTATMLAFSAAALLAIYAILRRIVASSTLALAAFVPFLAGSAFLISGRLSPLEVFSVWPMRYGGPYLLAWLLARHLDGAAPRRRWLVLLAGALVALNNLEFGLPALGGALAALAYVDPPRSRLAALRLARDLVAGVLAAAALVTALTLVQGGELPHPALLLEFPRIYGIGGWVLEPMATMGFHITMYVTFAAAIVVATVRAVRGDDGAALTGMLVWSGVFGLGAGSYYVGRSDPLNLIAMFSAWSLALMLLTIVVVRALVAAGATRRPSLPELAVLFGCGLAACAVSQLPQPWTEIARVGQTTAPIYRQPLAMRLVRDTTRPGEKVAILIPLGHRIAYDAGVVDVAPYASVQSMPTANQLGRTLAVMRREGVVHAYVDGAVSYPALLQALIAAGWKVGEQRDQAIMLRKARP
jgi:hypothetical protein